MFSPRATVARVLDRVESHESQGRRCWHGACHRLGGRRHGPCDPAQPGRAESRRSTRLGTDEESLRSRGRRRRCWPPSRSSGRQTWSSRSPPPARSRHRACTLRLGKRQRTVVPQAPTGRGFRSLLLSLLGLLLGSCLIRQFQKLLQPLSKLCGCLQGGDGGVDAIGVALNLSERVEAS